MLTRALADEPVRGTDDIVRIGRSTRTIRPTRCNSRSVDHHQCVSCEQGARRRWGAICRSTPPRFASRRLGSRVDPARPNHRRQLGDRRPIFVSCGGDARRHGRAEYRRWGRSVDAGWTGPHRRIRSPDSVHRPSSHDRSDNTIRYLDPIPRSIRSDRYAESRRQEGNGTRFPLWVPDVPTHASTPHSRS